MDSKKVFSMNLRARMYVGGLKNADISTATGVNIATVSAWTTGKAIPGSVNLDKLADYFHVPVASLFSEKIEV